MRERAMVKWETAVAAAIDERSIAIEWIADSAVCMLMYPDKLRKVTRAHVPSSELRLCLENRQPSASKSTE
ncbi:unnamed protein product [Angiostrongylus costaricensis]|uniref:RNase H domain-containing protein n=1 Tax=Angiostrongylus costaricensis TaxID=334426 RepID=A0A158PMG5_ANGCS|nr:unnamed protein product [Angiostrongylus costaricensis]